MRYFLGFFATILLIILLIVLLVRGGGSKQKVPSTSKPLHTYATSDAAVSLTIDAPINANSQHQQVRVTVDRDNVTLEEFTGYDGQTTKMQKFANSQNAFEAFLLALEQAGFTQGDKSISQEERGICPLGDRYIYMLKQGDKTIERYWATSCNGVKSYLGSVNLTNNLFQAQVPDYNDLTQDVRL